MHFVSLRSISSLLPFVGIIFLVSSLSWRSTLAAPNVQIPKNIQIFQDDRVVTLYWDGGVLQVYGIGGYHVFWGPVSDPNNTKVTVVEFPIAQLQPIENGVPYRAYIVSVDYYGWTSAPSLTINFTGDPSRVDQLRQQMTGFFEDYNLPEGPVPELTWNTAWYSQNDHSRAGVFINNQFHLHNMLAAKIDPTKPNKAYTRMSFSYMRPRAYMYFNGNETRTVTFDIDGHARTNWWMLDIIDATYPIDLTGHQDIRELEPSAPRYHVRFQTDLNEAIINFFGENYKQQELCRISNFDYLFKVGLATNVRIPWKIRVSRYYAEIFVRDIRICAGNISLPFDRAILLWGNVSYRSEGARNVERWISHWDNFGFDGPRTLLETHNYRVGLGIGADIFPVQLVTSRSFRRLNQVALAYGVTVIVSIPDDITNTVAARVHFSIEVNDLGNSYKYDANDQVTVNGQTYTWPDYLPNPFNDPFATRNFYSSFRSARPVPMVIRVAESHVQTGDNVLVFRFSDPTVIVTNVHIEVDFSTAPCAPPIPPYTPPVFAGAFHPTTTNLATGLYFAYWNKEYIWPSGNGPIDHMSLINPYDFPGRVPLPVSGAGTLTFKATGLAAVLASGLYPTLREVTVEIDHVVVWYRRTDNKLTPPSGIYVIPINTTNLSEGVHEIFIWGVSSNGVRTLLDQKDIHPLNREGYWPLLIDVRNTNRTNAPSPTRSSTSTPKPSATRSSTPTISSTRITPTARITATASLSFSFPTSTRPPTSTVSRTRVISPSQTPTLRKGFVVPVARVYVSSNATEGQAIVIDCRQVFPGSMIMQVTSATYGNVDMGCFEDPMKVQRILADLIIGYQVRTLTVSACMLGFNDPCGGLDTLSVTVACARSPLLPA